MIHLPLLVPDSSVRSGLIVFGHLVAAREPVLALALSVTQGATAATCPHRASTLPLPP